MFFLSCQSSIPSPNTVVLRVCLHLACKVLQSSTSTSSPTRRLLSHVDSVWLCALFVYDTTGLCTSWFCDHNILNHHNTSMASSLDRVFGLYNLHVVVDRLCVPTLCSLLLTTVLCYRISWLHYCISWLHYRISVLHYRISVSHYRISVLHYCTNSISVSMCL
jgi:lysylphosphatidylglycerol synthetase-like protein (DUF2156 family)